ncbi:MAG: ferrous iron transport protein B [Bacteroidales bacterium]|nr:ferrous iron transport protein B [Bacteroidales bacterium]
MQLSELHTGEKAVIAKVSGHGSFRKRLIEMGFIRGKAVRVILNAPLKDPIEYEILGYKVSLRREEASKIEVISEEEAKQHIASEHAGESLPAILDREIRDLAFERSHNIRVALVGNPNCGKTSLFNIASGSHEHVGNYSGVTVDAKEGKFEYKGYKITLVDLPGTYSLSAYSPEELYVRKNLLEKTPDVVLNVVDASNIERNLYLTAQLIDMNLPVVMALNMFDELQEKGDNIDTEQLGHLLGMPICPTVCRSGKGVPELFDTIIEMCEGPSPRLARHIHINHGHELEQSIDRVKLILQQDQDLRARYSTRYLAIKYMENDSDIAKVIAPLPFAAEVKAARDEEEERIQRILGTNAESAIVDAKYAFIQGALAETYTHGSKAPRHTFTDKIDAIVTNKWLAFPIFIAILYLIFYATFTLGEYPMNWIDWLVGKFGDLVASVMVDGWLKDLVVDGIIAGVGSVLVFLPNILILYFFISIMEDTGYMARTAFIVDKLMHHLGLHGKSFIPMVMGFGCNVPAIMATRTIESRKSRIITIALVPFMSCAGRLPIFVLLVGAFFPKHAALALLCIYALGVLLAILSALVLKKMIKDDDLPFVMELPPYRIPTAKAIGRHTWEKGKQYLQKMATTILIASVVIWALGYYPKNEQLPASEQQEQSYLGHVGKAIAPALDPLGFDWRMDVGLLTGVAAKELVVSSLGVMYAGEELEEADENDTVLQSALKQTVPLPVAVAFMIFVLLYFPCIATFVAIKNETGRWSWAWGICAYTIAVAWVFAWIGKVVCQLII